jgi:hypothetical protein
MIDRNGLRMRPVFVVVMLFTPLLAACTESTANRVDERTFKIESPPMAGNSESANRRLANRICPKGYRVIDSVTQRGGADRAAGLSGDNDPMTVWQIRCL